MVIKSYAVIGQKDGRCSIIHDGIPDPSVALSYARVLDEYTNKQFVTSKRAPLIVTAINGEATTLDHEALRASVEDEIKSALARYAHLVGRNGVKPLVKEIFIGHEDYSAQIILDGE